MPFSGKTIRSTLGIRVSNCPGKNKTQRNPTWETTSPQVQPGAFPPLLRRKRLHCTTLWGERTDPDGSDSQDGSMGRTVYLPTWMVDFYGFFIDHIYMDPMGFFKMFGVAWYNSTSTHRRNEKTIMGFVHLFYFMMLRHVFKQWRTTSGKVGRFCWRNIPRRL